ncbi:MAG: enoyl-CoA hydratase-related protein [Pseudomonadota bacterium]
MSDTIKFETLQVSRDGVAALVQLERPDVHNAFNQVLIAELIDVFNSLGADPTVRVVILSGAGKNFCAGADLDWMRAARDWTEEQNRADAANLAQMLRTIAECPKPVVARVQGAAFGGGVGLAAAADICLASPNAKFCLSEVKLGLTPSTISPHVMQAMGAREARRYWLTAEVMDANTAREVGLVHETLASEEAMDIRIQELVSLFAGNAPGAVSETKELIRMVAASENDQDLDQETAARIARRRVGAEAQEGLAAFFDKRRPNWAAEANED